MTELRDPSDRKILDRLHPNLLLLIGVLTIVASHLSYSIDAVVWFSSVPFLLYLYRTKGRRSRLLFTLALFLAWTLATAKIITEPIPFAMVFLFSLPLTLIHLPAYLIWDKFKSRQNTLFLFPLIFVLMEWLQYTFMPFASWGVAANAQSHSLVMLQSLSLFGLAGLSFLIYWVNSAIADILQRRRVSLFNAYLPFAVLLLFHIYGSLRLDVGNVATKDTVTVAAIGTDSDINGLPFADSLTNLIYKSELINRTKRAAEKGAKVICWNEAAVFIQKGEERDWQDTLNKLAKTCSVSLIAAYVVPLSTDPLQLENKFLSINSEGETVYEYLKHHPVPGEPSLKGDTPFKIMVDHGLHTGGAICYDFDYPDVARAFQRLNANLVVIPSSDWKGVAALHTRMAAFRAIEQGYSLLRSTRFGLSAAIDPYGEILTQQSSFDTHDKIMLAELPTKTITTLYSIIGDSFVFACFGLLVLLLTSAYMQKHGGDVSNDNSSNSPHARG